MKLFRVELIQHCLKYVRVCTNASLTGRRMLVEIISSQNCCCSSSLSCDRSTHIPSLALRSGKPETPHAIRVSDVTSSSFKIQFSPSFDGGAGPQRFLIEVTVQDRNTTFNSTIVNQQLPFNTYEYIVNGKHPQG